MTRTYCLAIHNGFSYEYRDFRTEKAALAFINRRKLSPISNRLELHCTTTTKRTRAIPLMTAAITQVVVGPVNSINNKKPSRRR